MQNLNIFTTSGEDIVQYLETFVVVLERKLLRCVEDQLDNAKYELSLPLDDFFIGINDVLQRYLPEMSQRDITEDAERKIRFSVDDIDSLPNTEEQQEEQNNMKDFIINFVNGWLTGATYGVYGIILGLFQINEAKREACNLLDKINGEFPTHAFTAALTKKKQFIIAQISDIYVQQLLDPIQQSFEEVQQNLMNRQEQLLQLQKEEEHLISSKEAIIQQINEMNELLV